MNATTSAAAAVSVYSTIAELHTAATPEAGLRATVRFVRVAAVVF
jgi:hypothetical protein